MKSQRIFHANLCSICACSGLEVPSNNTHPHSLLDQSFALLFRGMEDWSSCEEDGMGIWTEEKHGG
ncbi:uncharacterized protein BDZ99DRAFT_143312 [Mytilinidion resinicola]|uniref:Uncharacterized protein n=1 Tax=Mytilinidion resinicola TaxID=574789 RepID=A0A6A6Y9J3_9PEZI|nr:uncharacterized protein BDZ99DRAFT_143312 [Mytilinidion resinicola]KAF2804795.1 hypothetical protein BDZ99DRAFT_143312 [Mytilinidion resinicola]